MSQNQNELHIMKQTKEEKTRNTKEERIVYEQNNSKKSYHKKNYVAILINLIFLLLAIFLEILVLSKILSVIIGTILIAVLVICSFLISSIKK